MLTVRNPKAGGHRPRLQPRVPIRLSAGKQRYRIFAMKRLASKGLIVLWLGWYLSGPIIETMDTWESPQNEMQDVFFNAGGVLTLLALAVVCRRSLHQILRHILTFVRLP